MKRLLIFGVILINMHLKADVRDDLIRAATNNDIETVKSLTAAGVVKSIDLTKEEGRSALGVAASAAALKGHKEIIEYIVKLVQSSFNVDQKNLLIKAALFKAITGGHENIVHYLFNAMNLNRDQKNTLLAHSLTAASLHGKLKLVNSFAEKINKLSQLELSRKEREQYFTNALIAAAKGGHKAIIKNLLSYGARLDGFYKTLGEFYEEDAILGQKNALGAAAAATGDLRATELLLEEGADSNVRDPNGDTVLLLLLRKAWGADRNEAEHEKKVREVVRPIVKLLLEYGAKANSQNTENGQTPLMWAAAWGRWKIVDDLFDHDAQTSTTDSKGKNAYHYAKHPRELHKRLYMNFARRSKLESDEYDRKAEESNWIKIKKQFKLEEPEEKEKK